MHNIKAYSRSRNFQILHYASLCCNLTRLSGCILRWEDAIDLYMCIIRYLWFSSKVYFNFTCYGAAHIVWNDFMCLQKSFREYISCRIVGTKFDAAPLFFYVWEILPFKAKVLILVVMVLIMVAFIFVLYQFSSVVSLR